MLDNGMVVYGSSLSDGHEHSEDNRPWIVAGGGGGTIRSGRQIAYRRETSLSRLHLSLLQRMGVARERFAAATRPLSELDASPIERVATRLWPLGLAVWTGVNYRWTQSQSAAIGRSWLPSFPWSG